VTAIPKEFGGRAEICGASAGLHLFVWIKRRHGGRITDVHGKAEGRRWAVYTVDPFCIRPLWRTGVVLGYAPLRERDIREGIRCLAAALK